MQQLWLSMVELWRSFLGAIIFYTILPIPAHWQPKIDRIARWCPIVGLFLGMILVSCNQGLTLLKTPTLLQSAILVGIWLGLTGGLHLDGAMDVADGLASTSSSRRLEVMSDSLTGAYGVMNAVMILLLKFTAITTITTAQWWLFPLCMAWGRWSQVTAIAFHPYLKPKGKGAFHHQNFRYPQDLLLGLGSIFIFAGITFWQIHLYYQTQMIVFAIGVVSALCVNYWFYSQLQGHTGDTYGAVVEWTEIIFLSVAIIIL